MSLWKEKFEHYHGLMTLATPDSINLETIGQYYQAPGTYTIFAHSGFTTSAGGVLTFLKAKGSFSLNGTADIEVNKACILTFGLYKNGVLVPDAETPHTFAASSKISTIAITSIVHLDKNDYLEVFAKSDTANTLLTPSTLNVALYGARR